MRWLPNGTSKTQAYYYYVKIVHLLLELSLQNKFKVSYIHSTFQNIPFSKYDSQIFLPYEFLNMEVTSVTHVRKLKPISHYTGES